MYLKQRKIPNFLLRIISTYYMHNHNMNVAGQNEISVTMILKELIFWI